MYLERGAKWMVAQCSPILERLANRGFVKIDDAADAIWRLGALITEPLYSRVLLGDPPADLDAAIEAQIENGVEAFKKIYAPE